MKTFEEFKNALGQRESGNNYSVVNRYGFTGRYQFGKPRLTDLGYRGTMTEFKNSPQLQEEYFLKHVADHAKNLSIYLVQARAAQGNWLTLSGLIAYAHLLGGGQAKKWAKGGADKTDGNGVYGKTYAKQFSGYAIPGYDESGVPSTTQNQGGEAKSATKIATQLGAGMDSLGIILLVGFGLGLIYYYIKS